jgi:hypothetical protein
MQRVCSPRLRLMRPWPYVCCIMACCLFLWRPICAAAGMNFAVIALNGGAMPVSAHVLESAAGTRLAAQLASGEIFAYAPVTDSTRLVFLGDVLALEPFGRLLGFASIGDLVLGVGAAMLCFTMLRPAKHSV